MGKSLRFDREPSWSPPHPREATGAEVADELSRVIGDFTEKNGDARFLISLWAYAYTVSGGGQDVLGSRGWLRSFRTSCNMGKLRRHRAVSDPRARQSYGRGRIGNSYRTAGRQVMVSGLLPYMRWAGIGEADTRWEWLKRWLNETEWLFSYRDDEGARVFFPNMIAAMGARSVPGAVEDCFRKSFLAKIQRMTMSDPPRGWWRSRAMASKSKVSGEMILSGLQFYPKWAHLEEIDARGFAQALREFLAESPQRQWFDHVRSVPELLDVAKKAMPRVFIA
jgi:hypothetical protein